MDHPLLILITSFFLIALIYASVGFGGGSSYLALLAILQVDYLTTRSTALLCNIIVVTGGTYIFFKERKLDLRRAWPFMVASVPMAFAGGYWRINESTFFVTLGITLIVASCFLWIQPPGVDRPQSGNANVNTFLGGGVGFLSGLVGIGGGIFLSPILHLTRWDEAKKISAVASLFILVNSISGLIGQFSRGSRIDLAFITPLLIAVLIGGQIGSRIGARKFNALYIKRITAILILAAGINVLKEHL